MDQIEQILNTLTREFRSLSRVQTDRAERLPAGDANLADSAGRTNELLWAIGVVVNARDGKATSPGDASCIWAGRTYVDSMEDQEKA